MEPPLTTQYIEDGTHVLREVEPLPPSASQPKMGYLRAGIFAPHRDQRTLHAPLPFMRMLRICPAHSMFVFNKMKTIISILKLTFWEQHYMPWGDSNR